MQQINHVRPTLRDILFTMFRYRITFLLTFSLVMTIGILVTTNTPRLYEAKTRVYIGTEVKQLRLNQSDQTLKVSLEELVATEVELIKSLPVIEKALQSTGPDNTGRSPSIDQIVSDLRVLPVRITTLIELRLQYPDRDYAIRLLDTIVSTYLDHRKLQTTEGNEQEHYQALLKDINDRISVTETDLQTFGAVHSITDITTQHQRDLDRIAVLSNSRIDLERNLLSLRHQERVLDSLRVRFAPERIPASILNEDPQLRSWVQEYAELSQKRLASSSELAKGAPALIHMDSQLSALTDHLQAQIALAASMRSQELSVKESELRLLDREITTLGTRDRELAGSSGEFASLEQQLEDLRSVRTVLTRQVEETRIRTADPGNVRVEQVERSQSPARPIKPNTLFNLTASFVLALVLGTSLPFYKQAVGGTLFHDYEVQRFTGLPVLCSVRNLS
jgi:uncharacterized protein involved in exopolysaccharide biosynthesis